MIDRMNIGISDSVSSPCAIVVLPAVRGPRECLVDVNPLFVPGRLGECVDAVLGNFDPVADADLCADSGLELFEVLEHGTVC